MPKQMSSSLSIALFSRFAPWDLKTCYRHLIYVRACYLKNSCSLYTCL